MSTSSSAKVEGSSELSLPSTEVTPSGDEASAADTVIDIQSALSLTLSVRERALARQNAKRWQIDTVWALVFACAALAGEGVVLGLESRKFAEGFTTTTPIYLTVSGPSGTSPGDPPFALAPSAQYGTKFFYWSMFSLMILSAGAQIGSLVSMGFFSSIFSEAMRRNGAL